MSTLATPYVSNWPDWPLLLEQAATIVRSYDTSVTLRQLFYRLVAAELLPNTTNAYKALSKYSAEARRAGSKLWNRSLRPLGAAVLPAIPL